jgi:hypothetical protein
MDIDLLRERREQLAIGVRSMQQQIVELTAGIHANNGAIQECDFWIARTEAEEGESCDTPAT